MDRNRILKQLRGKEIQADGKRTVFQVDRELGQGGNGAAFVVKSSAKQLAAKFYIPPDTRDLDDAAFKRFQREVQLVNGLAHPFVIQAHGTGIVKLGSYSIPFYLMPLARGTLRDLVPPQFDASLIDSALRAFMRTCLGVSYLHHHGIVHRDLKPENVLLFQFQTPRVSDLGIAHVAPSFANWSRLTVPADRLMNRDYYAPEQRFGDATAVDHRADIYSLGCILYELVTGTPPVRPNLPSLADLDPNLKPLAKVYERMTAHQTTDRYDCLDLALDDFVWAIKALDLQAHPTSVGRDDERDLAKFLKSANAATRGLSLEIAQRLGRKSLAVLHQHLSHAQLDTVTTAYKVLGELAAGESIPYLVAGLYPQRHRRRHGTREEFRTGPFAANALERYPVEERIKAIDQIKDMVQLEDIKVLTAGLPESAFPATLRLYKGGFLHTYNADAGLVLLASLSRENAWPLIEKKLEGGYEIDAFMDLLPIYEATPQYHQQIIDYHLRFVKKWPKWAQNWGRLCDGITTSSLPLAEKQNRLKLLLDASKAEGGEKTASIAEALAKLGRRDDLPGTG